MNIPPKTMRDQAKQWSGSPGNLLPDTVRPLSPVKAEAGQSLPVLEAFQEFLNAERRRARNRLWTVMLCFAALMAAFATTAWLAGSRFLERTAREVSEVREEMQTLKTASLDARKAAQTDLSALTGETGKLRDDISREQAALSTLRTDLHAQIGLYSNDLQKMQELVGAVEERIATVATDLKERLAQTLQPPAPSFDTHAAAAQAQSDSALSAPSGTTLSFTLTPRGEDREATWLLPIPQE